MNNNLNKIFSAGFRDISRSPFITEAGRKYKYAYTVYSETERENAKRWLDKQGFHYRIKEKTVMNRVIGWEVYVSYDEV